MSQSGLQGKTRNQGKRTSARSAFDQCREWRDISLPALPAGTYTPLGKCNHGFVPVLSKSGGNVSRFRSAREKCELVNVLGDLLPINGSNVCVNNEAFGGTSINSIPSHAKTKSLSMRLSHGSGAHHIIPRVNPFPSKSTFRNRFFPRKVSYFP